MRKIIIIFILVILFTGCKPDLVSKVILFPIPLELGELSPKEIRIPLAEIDEKTATYTSYYSSNPAAYYYDEGGKGQKQGTIDDIK